MVKPKPVPKPKPVQDKAPKPQERVAPQPAVVRSPVSQPATPPAPPAPKANAQAVENGYLQVLRRELELRKRYPSGRRASLERPQGNVEVWLEVDRSGRVLASGIASKAPSMLLNRAALSALQSISQLKPFLKRLLPDKEAENLPRRLIIRRHKAYLIICFYRKRNEKV